MFGNISTDGLLLVAQFIKDGNVSGQGGWVAGDVDNALGLHSSKGLEYGRRAASSWRIYYYDISTNTLLVEAWHNDCGIPYQEVGVADVVVTGVLLRIEDGRFDDFYTDDLTGFLGEEQGNRSGAAVGVNDGLRYRSGSAYSRALL